jgi:hypothetical protein
MSIIGTVKIIRVQYREDDVFEGSIPRECYELAREDLFECDDIEDAVRYLSSLSFAATGNDWAADPDGSRIIHYGEGIREETTGHLIGFSEADTATIIERVG